MNNNGMRPNSGIFYDASGNLRDFFGNSASELPNGLPPINSEFFSADGSIHNISELVDVWNALDLTNYLHYFDPQNNDWSIETNLPAITDGAGNLVIDYEIGHNSTTLPHAGLTGDSYDAAWLAIGGQKQFNFGENPDGGTDTASTEYILNVGDSNVDKQVLSWNRPFWYNGKDGTRHWFAMSDDLPPVPTTDGSYTLQATVSGGVTTYQWASQ
jgi:hypothetical protein